MRGRREGVRERVRRRLGRFRVEQLETRQLLSTFTVTSTGDDDVMGTLRWAINQANGTAGQDTIAFDIPGAGVQTIQPQSPLPTITDQVIIDGTTQDPLSATPVIELDGSQAGASVDGLRLSSASTTTASGSVVSGLAINRFSGAGIAILSGANTIAVRTNFLGTDPTGTVALPNDVGVSIRNSFSNSIGGSATSFRNLISGNTRAGVEIVGATGLANVVQANIIGLAIGGGSALPNMGPGVLIGGDGSANSGARSNTVGGSLAAARNFIGGNVGPGIRIQDTGATGNQIQGNFIGTNTSGTSAIANDIGVELRGGSASTTIGGASAALRNVISGNTTADILIDDSDTNVVAGNLIGTNSDGTAAIPGNAQNNVGILIRRGSTNNTIGGTTASAGNVISGHQDAGVWIRGIVSQGDTAAAANVLQGNVIGAAIGGSSALPNTTGVRVSDGTTNNTIGGTASGARNIISGNTGNGIELTGSATTGNIIQANVIGTASDGTTSLPNGDNGIFIDGALNTSIGGTVTGSGNTIAFNNATGVRIDAGTGNIITRNSIFSNGDLGIIVPNGLQNAPVLTAASTSGSTTTITGSLTATASTTYTVEFYSNVTGDPSGTGEGQTFIGSTTVTTDSTGLGNFTAGVSPAAGLGQVISSIAIAPNGNTSQFSNNVTNSEPTADLAISMTAAATPPAPAGQVPTGTFYTYTITATNNGPNNVSNVTVSDTLPTGTTFVGGTSTTGSISQSGNTITVTLPTLNANTSQTITLTIVSPATIPSGGSITNTATISAGSGGSDPTPGNNSASLTTTVVQGVDLSVTQTVNPNPAFVNSQISFIISVSNLSTTTATNVVVTDTLPAGLTNITASSTSGTATVSGNIVTVSIAQLPPTGITGAGSSAVITITATTPATAGSLTNTATATATQPQTVANDNTSTVTFTVQRGTQPSDQAPTVASVARTGIGNQPSRLQVVFNSPLTAASAARIQNYMLVSAGPDGRFGTADDRRIPLAGARYNSTTNTVTVTAFSPYSRHLLTQLTVVGQPNQGVQGTNGLFLAGTNGREGTNYVVRIKGAGPVGATRVARAFSRRGR